MMIATRSRRFFTLSLWSLWSAAVVLPAAGQTLPASTEPALSDAQKVRVTPVVLAYRKAQPAVVNISAQVLVDRMDIFGADPLDNIFNSPMLRPRAVQSLGSGVVINAAGYIVTNAHVVRRASKITVTMLDRTQYDAKIIAADPAHDLAVLKVSPPEGKTLPYLPLGRSDDLMVGETVIAIGNPMGYANSVTTGVVSAVNRELEFSGGVKYQGLIQTDAPINPGNSGGPLLNINGELIGINSAIRADAQNIGFAIPVDALSGQLCSLLDYERINRVIIGVSVVQKHLDKGDELVISQVRGGTPANDKLKSGDRVLSIDGQAIAQISDFACLMLRAKAGTPLRVKVLRDQQPLEVQITPQARPKPDGKALAIRTMGLTLRPVDEQLASDLGLQVERGLMVTEVEKGSPADKAGVHRRDVLFQMGRFYVKDLDELGSILEGMPAGQVKIGVVRGNVAAWVNITLRGEK